jgi:hypothetical protein
MWPVDRMVGNVKNNGAQLLTPVWEREQSKRTRNRRHQHRSTDTQIRKRKTARDAARRKTRK